jgi:hypothetical protein
MNYYAGKMRAPRSHLPKICGLEMNQFNGGCIVDKINFTREHFGKKIALFPFPSTFATCSTNICPRLEVAVSILCSILSANKTGEETKDY